MLTTVLTICLYIVLCAIIPLTIFLLTKKHLVEKVSVYDNKWPVTNFFFDIFCPYEDRGELPEVLPRIIKYIFVDAVFLLYGTIISILSGYVLALTLLIDLCINHKCVEQLASEKKPVGAP